MLRDISVVNFFVRAQFIWLDCLDIFITIVIFPHCLFKESNAKEQFENHVKQFQKIIKHPCLSSFKKDVVDNWQVYIIYTLHI